MFLSILFSLMQHYKKIIGLTIVLFLFLLVLVGTVDYRINNLKDVVNGAAPPEVDVRIPGQPKKNVPLSELASALITNQMNIFEEVKGLRKEIQQTNKNVIDLCGK
jgi:hypothetical protein